MDAAVRADYRRHPEAARRLVVYGSLAPGEQHADLLAPLKGAWEACRIRGHIDRSGPYPFFHPDDGGPWQEALLFRSPGLQAHWPALDRFEGDEYVRCLVEAVTAKGCLRATVYAAYS